MNLTDIDLLHRLAVALTVGLVVGFERGWHERDAKEGTRVAGIRTFALTGFAGGLTAVLGIELSPLVAAVIALGIVGLILAARLLDLGPHAGLTTETASLATFALGGLAGMGHLLPAMAGALAMAFLLGAKAVLHRFLRGIQEREVFAFLQLLLISLVILPLLPDEGYGPYAALNPHRLWWMVVLVAAISFIGYVAAKLLGPQASLPLIGMCGGLVSSTATTVALSRRARELGDSLVSGAVAGIVASSTVMMARVAILASIVHPPLLSILAAPFGAAVLAGIATGLWQWRKSRSDQHVTTSAPGNPLELGTALGYGVLMAVVLVLAEVFRANLGAAGMYVLAAISGTVDTDAITLSVATLAREHLAQTVAVVSLMIAVGVNTAAKVVLAGAAGPKHLPVRVAVPLALMLASGGGAFVLERLWSG